MSNIPPKKPVNDLIKFWAEKQENEKKKPDPISKSPRRPLSPNPSLPASPRNDSFPPELVIKDTKQSDSEGNVDSIINIQTLSKKNEQGRMDWSSLPPNDSSNEETSSQPSFFLALKSIPPVPAKDSYITRPRDHNLNTKDAFSKIGPLPPARKVTDLVNKFEKVASPTNSATSSPRLAPMKRSQTYPTSPLALSPINTDQLTPEPLSLSTQPTSSPISPISHISVEMPNVKVSEPNQNLINIPIINQPDLEPLQQTTSPVQTSFNQSDQKNSSKYIPRYSNEHGFLLPEITPISPFWKPTTESTPISPLWIPKNGNNPVSPLWKPVSETMMQNKTFTSREIPEITSDSNNASNPFASSSHHEIPDLLPRPEPISPMRLSFSDFLKSPNGSSTNMSHLPLDNGTSSYDPFSDANQIDMYKVVKSGDKKNQQSLPSAKDTNAFIMEMHESNIQQSRSISEKDENSSTIKPTFTVKLIENLRYYFQPNKISDETRESSSRNINSNGEQCTMTISLRKSGSFRTYNLEGGTKYRKRQFFNPIQIKQYPYSATRPERNSLSPANTLKKNPFLIKKKIFKDTHDLPEYNKSKSKMSMLVPLNLSSVEYGKNNHSLPDLSVRYRHNKFNDMFRKNNMTVPNFTRVGSLVEDDPKKPDFAMAIMTDADLNPSKVTKFSINPFDESESNELFKPDAPWIHLPHLDEFIKSLPQTKFSEPKDLMTAEEYEKFTGYGKSDDKTIEAMFPPMNQVPEGICLDDLKRNIVKNDDLLSQNKKNNLLDVAIDSILAGQTALAGSKMTRLEIIRDFVQILALALSFVTTSIFGNWVKAILDTIPNLLSFNLDHVFGYGITFLFTFCTVVFGSLYWFRMMTKYDPNADVEGLESHPWNIRPESKRNQNIAVIFILTTLYLPLSKLSLDALVWSESFWPIPNPYRNNGQNIDYPNFGGGSSSNTIRDPQDFCYVTSMNKEELNFSPVIIAIALISIGILTFWFPIALKRLVVKNLPKIDKYNEMGEKRNNPDEEYKRLLEKDNCPYNFLYTAYNEQWASYKTFVMATKFFLIFFVSVISKDNCLFRSFPRVRVDTIRSGLQISFMFVLFLIHWQSEPFLHRNQNLSEYWSRIGYVITSILGLLVILNVGPEKQIGIALTVVNVFIFVVIIWYVIIQTDRYKSFVKVIRKKLEFSLNIYSPKLDFTKHIKRRVWQETWTTLLLTSEQFKMCDGKTVAFSQSPFRPPYLLNFSGTVAERHVENLKIIRQIGIKNYTSAMAPLSASLAKLRSTIVNNFVGPDMYYAPEFLAPKIKTCFGKAYVVPFPFSVVMVYDDDESVLILTQEWEIQRYVQQNENNEIQRRRLVRQKLRSLEGKIILGPCFEGSDIDKLNVDNYRRGLLSIKRNKRSKWHNHNMNPGFKITVSYSDAIGASHKRVVGHDVLGITDDFQMTYQLQKLFSDNKNIIEKDLEEVQKIMDEYRQYYRDEARRKEEILTYGFFVNIYDNPSIPLESLPALLITTEENKLIQEIPESEYPSLIYLYERMRVVNLSRVHQWWYLFWEDLWRKNHKEMPDFAKNPQYFSPAYRTSICYYPMTRMELEEFLEKHGCSNGGKHGFLHSGVLNRIYLYLNNAVFGGKPRKDGTFKKWNITMGDTIKKGADNSGHIRRTMRERATVMKDIMLRRKRNFSRTRPFFVLHEEEDSDSEDANSDGVNSASEEETWW